VEEVANLAMVLWRAWSNRNKVTQVGESLSISRSVEFLMQLDRNMELAGVRGSKGQGEVIGQGSLQKRKDSAWFPPAQDAIKINCDGAFNPVTGVAALGVIARDQNGQSDIMAWQVVTRCRNAEEARGLN
jgi:hypothetical protein